VPVSRDIRAAIEQLATELASLGCRVEERLPEVNFAEQRELFRELANLIVQVFQPHPEGTPPLTLADYFTALHRRDDFIRAWNRFFDEWDVLLCPITATTAFPHCATGTPLDVDGEMVEYWKTTAPCGPATLTGHPTVAIPLSQDGEGLPIGVQVVGQRWGEERLLAIAKLLVEVTGGYRRPTGY
jgi:amidase